jgi:hypothetical protein
MPALLRSTPDFPTTGWQAGSSWAVMICGRRFTLNKAVL